MRRRVWLVVLIAGLVATLSPVPASATIIPFFRPPVGLSLVSGPAGTVLEVSAPGDGCDQHVERLTVTASTPGIDPVIYQNGNPPAPAPQLPLLTWPLAYEVPAAARAGDTITFSATCTNTTYPATAYATPDQVFTVTDAAHPDVVTVDPRSVVAGGRAHVAVFGGCPAAATERVEVFVGHDAPPPAPGHADPGGIPTNAELIQVAPAGGTPASAVPTGYEAEVAIPATWTGGVLQVTAMCLSSGVYSPITADALVAQVLGPVSSPIGVPAATTTTTTTTPTTTTATRSDPPAAPPAVPRSGSAGYAG